MNVGTKKTKCYLTERIIQGAKTKIIISKNVKKEKFKLVGAAPVQSQENHQYIYTATSAMHPWTTDC